MPRPEEPTALLTAAEVAAILRISPARAVRLCRDGKLPASKPAGQWRISVADLAAHIESSRFKAAS